MAKSNLVVRVLTSLVALPVVLALLLFGPPLAWFALVAIAAAIGAFELFKMIAPDDRVLWGLGVVMTLGVVGALYFASDDRRVLLTLSCALPVGSLLVPLFRFKQVERAGLELMAMVAGPFYVGALLVTSALMRRDQGAFGARWVVLALSIAWLADTGAYFVGRAFGKAKLYPAVSPGKTRAGLWGALAASTLAGLVASLTYLPTLPPVHGCLLGVVAGLLGQLGDLVESLLKRSVGVKDSGALIPGHGGMLDRVDALIFVSPTVYLYLVWFG